MLQREYIVNGEGYNVKDDIRINTLNISKIDLQIKLGKPSILTLSDNQIIRVSAGGPITVMAFENIWRPIILDKRTLRYRFQVKAPSRLFGGAERSEGSDERLARG